MTLPDTTRMCPMTALLQLLDGPRTTCVLWTLRREGPTRLARLRLAVGDVSPRALSLRLARLEAAGVVQRQPDAAAPHQVVYALTERGRELNPALDALHEVAQRWAGEDSRLSSR